jgi:hypothetical protein
MPLPFLQIPIAFIVLLDPLVNHDTIYGHTHLSTLMCLISSGYFLYDLLIVIARREGVGMLVHAACCLFVYTYAVYSFYLHFFGEWEGGTGGLNGTKTGGVNLGAGASAAGSGQPSPCDAAWVLIYA